MNVVLLTGDLMVVSRVAGAASQAGAELRTAANATQAVEMCRKNSARVLIIDLSTPGVDVAALVEAAKGDGDQAPAIIAFGPHVHEERLAAAREAGCDQVLSRG